ncbi:MAG: hypothetical protein FJX56_01730 [Alphaproteobacteria bacterium]|nr:hypothetical protein [Alphaproteobacteria bacterium]
MHDALPARRARVPAGLAAGKVYFLFAAFFVTVLVRAVALIALLFFGAFALTVFLATVLVLAVAFIALLLAARFAGAFVAFFALVVRAVVFFELVSARAMGRPPLPLERFG